jgi:hypothetical protein
MQAHTLDEGGGMSGISGAAARRLLSREFSADIAAREQFIMELGSQLGLGADLSHLHLGPVDTHLSQGETILGLGATAKQTLACMH